MRYDLMHNSEYGWIVEDDGFDKNFLGKTETIMCLGNGRIGIRSANEENYKGEVRNTFIAGTFNKFDENEVTELPNIADLINIKINLNGLDFDLTTGKIKKYSKQLNIKTGELTRDVHWMSEDGDEYLFKFYRFVSLKDLHVIGQKVKITPLNNELTLKICSGINAQMTNSGVQHFSEGDKRLYESKYLQLVQKTTESKIQVVLNTTHNFFVEDEEVCPENQIFMDRRLIAVNYTHTINKNKTFTFEKLSNIYTSRDKEFENSTLDKIKEHSYKKLVEVSKNGYEYNFNLSKEEWQNKIWDKYNIEIETKEVYDKLAIRFAQYHLTVMTPAHDNRMNIGAKGLSGEGYKGHTFWDTELFMLPFFTYTNPKVARSLLEYRYLTLGGAHKKAKENGYDGAMFPWESAWLHDGEVTPVWGAADIVTGKATKIWSGFIEQHITSDIAFACWQYYKVTNDEEFMELYGYELFMDTAKFWQSRLEWDEKSQTYHINDVIGPDEYKEHVNNNAFTNYTAHWTIKNAMKYCEVLKNENTDLYKRLDEKLDLKSVYKKWCEKVDKIYLPKPREEDLVIAQDDTYLSKKIIDLTKYKNQENVGSLFQDYNLEAVNQIQVSKQADIMILFYILEDLFDKDVKVANWNYYEPKTLHDSSLSLSTHSVLANDLGETEKAYNLFKKASEIDLGPNMKTSDHGIHAASLGGLWQCVVCGFGGVRMIDGHLRLEPSLPLKWDKLKFPINWHGDLLNITITNSTIEIENKTNNNKEIKFILKDKTIKFSNSIKINY